METWRIFLAVTLMLGVIVLTNILFPPPPPPPRDAGALPDSAAAALPTADTLPGALDTAAGPAPADPLAAVDSAPPGDTLARVEPAPPARVVVVESPLYRYRLSSAGGALVGAELLEYESFTREGAVELAIDSLAPLVAFGLRAGGREASLTDLTFRTDAPDTVRLQPGESGREVELIAALADGSPVSLVYSFSADSYAVDLRGRAELGPLADQTSLLIRLSPTLAINEQDAREDRRNLGYVTNGPRRGVRSESLGRVTEPTVDEGPLSWAAVKNKYFVTAVFGLPDQERYLGGLLVDPTPLEDAALMAATLPLERDGGFALRMYMGPQESDRLAAMGSQFGDVNPLGWSFLGPIIRPLARIATWALVGMRRVSGLAYGWVVILFGLLINLLIWPLNMRAMRSQLRNMEVQPRMKEVQALYKDQPERLQKEMMKLYKEEGFNPFGGCLPMLIPMPILFTLFFVFQATIEFRGTEFLWLPDLSRPDPLYIIPVLMAISMFLLQYLSFRSTPEPNPQLKFMMWFMPIFMLVILLRFAAGLNLYYASSNVARLPQQLYIMKERRKAHERQAAKKEKEKAEQKASVPEPEPVTDGQTRAERRRGRRTGA
ncbi:MAG: membrane protein insertase YidC [Gemmatimonadota bacterium]